MKILKRFDKQINLLSKKVKKCSDNNPYSYMIQTSGNFYHLFFPIVFNAKPKGLEFDIKKTQKKINTLTDNEIKSTIKLFLLDYFPFVENDMVPLFKKMFPNGFDSFKEDFITVLELKDKEREILDELYKNYDFRFHADLMLKTMKFPDDQDNLFFAETVDELKTMIFHQINKNITKFFDS